jgi:FkbM family methyltransferase
MKLTEGQKHLKELSEKPEYVLNAIPSKTIDHLCELKKGGFNPKVIYDIGSCVGHWYNIASLIFPEATIYCFEGNPEIEFIYKEKGIKNYHIGLLSNEDNKSVKYYFCDKHPGGNSYYREVGNTNSRKDFKEYKELTANKIDTICKLKNYPPPDFVKIDVQGAERDILEGGEILKNAEYMVIELQHTEYNKGAPKVNTTLPYIESLGYKCIKKRIVGGSFDDDYCFKKIKTGGDL